MGGHSVCSHQYVHACRLKAWMSHQAELQAPMDPIRVYFTCHGEFQKGFAHTLPRQKFFTFCMKSFQVHGWG